MPKNNNIGTWSLDLASNMENVVIDAGGGAVIDPENVENFKKKGVVICLCAEPEVILERTKRYSHRPLLNVENSQEKVEELLKFRVPFYAQADFSIDTTALNIEQVTDRIKKILAL